MWVHVLQILADGFRVPTGERIEGRSTWIWDPCLAFPSRGSWKTAGSFRESELLGGNRLGLFGAAGFGLGGSQFSGLVLFAVQISEAATAFDGFVVLLAHKNDSAQ